MADSENLNDDVVVKGKLTSRPSGFSENVNKESKSDSDESLLDINDTPFDDNLLLAASKISMHAKTVDYQGHQSSCPSSAVNRLSPTRLSDHKLNFNQPGIVSQQSFYIDRGTDHVTAVPPHDDLQTAQAYLNDILASAGHLSPRQTRFNPFDFPSPTERHDQALTAHQDSHAGSSQVRPRDFDQFDQLNFGDPTFISSYFKTTSASSKDTQPFRSDHGSAVQNVLVWNSDRRSPSSSSSLQFSNHHHTPSAALTSGLHTAHPSSAPRGLVVDDKYISALALSSGTGKQDGVFPSRGSESTRVTTSAPVQQDVVVMAVGDAEWRNTAPPGLILQDYTTIAAPSDQLRAPSLITKPALGNNPAPERTTVSGVINGGGSERTTVSVAMNAFKQPPRHTARNASLNDGHTRDHQDNAGAGVLNSKFSLRYDAGSAPSLGRHFEDDDDDDEEVRHQEAAPLLDSTDNSRTSLADGWRVSSARGARVTQVTGVSTTKTPHRHGWPCDQNPPALSTCEESNSGACGGMIVPQGERDSLKLGARGITPHSGATDSTKQQSGLHWQRNSYGELSPLSGGETNVPTVTYRHCHKKRLASLTDKLALRQLVSAVVLCILFMTGEAVGGALSNSLALFTDVLHLGSDLVSFIISLLAMWLANKPATKKMSFGYHRAEVIGALLSVFLIWLVSGVLCYIAVERIIEGHYINVKPDEMLITASLGVLFNFIMAFVLHSEVCCGKAHSHNKFGHGHSHGGHGHSHGGQGHAHGSQGHSDHFHKDLLDVAGQDGQHQIRADEGEGFNYHRLHSHEPEFEPSGHQMRDVTSQLSPSEGGNGLTEEEALHKHKNINVRAAFIHVVGDIIQSLGVLIAALIIKFTDDDKFRLADPICTFLFSVIVLITTITVLRDALLVIMEGVPRDLSFESLKQELLTLEGVVAVHSLHIWALTMDRNALSVHLAIENPFLHNQVLTLATKLIQDRHHYMHTTIQVELYDEVAMRDCKDCLEPK